MIRFIDLKDQITEGDDEFAFFDTVNGKFIELDGESTWSCASDFSGSFISDREKYPGSIRRFMDKIPIRFFSEDQQEVFGKVDDGSQSFSMKLVDDHKINVIIGKDKYAIIVDEGEILIRKNRLSGSDDPPMIVMPIYDNCIRVK